MTPIKRKLLYIFRGTLLRLRITWNHGQSVTISVGYHVDRTDPNGKPKWDGSRCVRNTFHGNDKIPASTINRILENLEERIDQVFYGYEQSDEIPTKDQIRNAIVANNERNLTIWQYYTQFLCDGERIHQWSANTIKSARNICALLKKYKPNLSFADINEGLIENFAVWQQSNRLSPNKFKAGQKGYANNVIRKNCTVFRWFIKWATSKGYIKYDVTQNASIQTKSIKRPVIYLTWDELIKLENYPFEVGTPLDRTRDFFCFCCFTSLRYSDAANLRKTDIGKDSFSVTSQKTSKPLIIDLNSHSRRILEKYKETEGIYAIPHIPLCNINARMKKIGKMLGFDEPVTISQYYGATRVDRIVPKHELLSTHCGRRTFISNAISMGIDPSIVMKWTGHAEYSAMRPYIDIADSIRKNAMKIFDK